jgi:hypothetical protein
MTCRFHTAVRVVLLAVTLTVCGVGELSSSASAAFDSSECIQENSIYYQSCAPGWELVARHFPTNLAPEKKGAIQIEVLNVGAGSSAGPVTVTDKLPQGVTATEAGDFIRNFDVPEDIVIEHVRWDCTGNGPGEPPGVAGATVVTCTNDPLGMPYILGGAGNTNYGSAGNAQIGIAVSVGADVAESEPVDCVADPTMCNQVSVAGGGAATSASTTDPIAISSKPSPFRFTEFNAWFSNADGTLDTQAGSHPYALTVSLGLATGLTSKRELDTPADVRNIDTELPPGFVGDPTAVPQCTRPQFLASDCSASSQVGVIRVDTADAFGDKFRVFNLVPPPGTPAEFGFHYEAKTVVYLDTGVRSGSDYGLTTHVDNIPQDAVVDSILTIWGIPADPSHNRWRGANGYPCSEEEIDTAGSGCSKIENPDLKPFLTLPTACPVNPVTEAPESPKFAIRADSWQHPEEPPIERSVLWHDSNGNSTGPTGCEDLGFGPTITTAPDTAKADSPAGLTVEVKPSVGGLSEPNGLSTADIQNTTVTLPEGLVINPGQAAGLQACQETEGSLKANDEAPVCPGASKVGTVEVETPLLPHSLKGNVYVLQSNPPNLKLLVTAIGEGVNLKLVGDVHLDERTGRLTTKFEGTPELPFTDFKLSFSGGAQAALDTPTQCGTYTTNADFDPWSSPFVADVFPTASFAITEGPGGGACPSSPMPFAPTLTAGSTTDQAGGFTGFSLLLSRGDGQQRIEKLQFREPDGAAGMISQVPLCPEPQAAQGTCSAASHIGHTVVTSGPGPYPLVVPQPGEPEAPIYLTGPYEGAPFGLSIVTPVIAGPFNLGTIVTRAKIEVDPLTAQITITTDALPQIVDGVPTDLRSVNAIIDRPDFLFNPTNCTPSSFSGTATSARGAIAAISSPFGIGSCQSLKFEPKFAVSTPGHTSKAYGAGLNVKLSYPNTPQGTQANITRVKVDLPKQLPSRLTTLQKACTNAQFEANPAGCPEASVIGHVTVTTPVLPVPLTGPAYFVSHGGEAFPSLIMVLQGYGVTVELVGTTFISKAGITSSTFKTVPDVPFSTFDLVLPQGKYSALAANGNLCTSKLVMPTEFLAQNGLKINESTPVTVTGCAKKKALTRAQKLVAALKACRKKAKGKRAGCEAAAREKDGSLKKEQAKKKK